MSDRLGPMPHDQLETELADLAMALAFPPTPDLAAAVGSRLRAPLANPGARPRLLPFRRSVRRSLLLAAALVLLVVGGALAVRFGGAALDRVRAASLRAARVGGPARTRSHGRRPRSRPAAHPGGGRMLPPPSTSSCRRFWAGPTPFISATSRCAAKLPSSMRRATTFQSRPYSVGPASSSPRTGAGPTTASPARSSIPVLPRSSKWTWTVRWASGSVANRICSGTWRRTAPSSRRTAGSSATRSPGSATASSIGSRAPSRCRAHWRSPVRCADRLQVGVEEIQLRRPGARLALSGYPIGASSAAGAPAPRAPT